MKLFSYLKPSREKQKETTINFIVSSILESVNKYDHTEQTEILNRVTIRLMERKKEKRTKLIQEARQLQESMINVIIDK